MKKFICILFSILAICFSVACSSDYFGEFDISVISAEEYRCSYCGTAYWGERQKIICTLEYRGTDIEISGMYIHIKQDPNSRPSQDPAYGTTIHHGSALVYNNVLLNDNDTYSFEICAPAFITKTTIEIQVVTEGNKERKIEKVITIQKDDN